MESSVRSKVGIIGCGLIGRSLAMLFAGGGYDVYLYDVSESQVTSALQEIASQLVRLEAEDCLRGTLSAADQIKRVHGCTDLAECVKGAVLIQENVPENLELKKNVYGKLDKILDDDVLVCSSTSSKQPSALFGDMVHRSQCIVAHPLSPPYFLPIVELVKSPWIREDLLARALHIVNAIGQNPVVVHKERLGHVLSRLHNAIFMEAYKLVRDDVISCEDLDKVTTEGLGLHWAFTGIFQTLHLEWEGFHDGCIKHEDEMEKLSKSFLPNSMPGEDVDLAKRMNESFISKVPLNALQGVRDRRDRNFAALSKLKRTLSKEH